MLCAIDGHAKNFSLFLLPGGRSDMTPLYDILSAYPLTAVRQLESQQVKMAMSWKGTSGRHGRWSTIMPRHCEETARICGLPKRESLGILTDCVERIGRAFGPQKPNFHKAFPNASLSRSSAGYARWANGSARSWRRDSALKG
jgi:serine/threonine-protein kinase HipA